MGRKLTIVSAGVVGAGLAYLLDPDRGRSRRARLADQTRARGRDFAESFGKKARYERQRMEGVLHELMSEQQPPKDDTTLLQKVRSEAIGPSGVPTDTLDVDVADGVVILRGTVRQDPEDLIKRITQVTGVRSVKSELSEAS